MQLNGRDERDRCIGRLPRPVVSGDLADTFVLREVEALRRLGRRVETMSIHRPRPRRTLPAAGRPGGVRRPPTSCRRRGFATTPAAHWQALRTRPGAYFSTLAAALRSGPLEPAVKARGAPVLLRGGGQRGGTLGGPEPVTSTACSPARRRRRHARGAARRRGLELEPGSARHRHAPGSRAPAWRRRSARRALSPCPAISVAASSWRSWARSTGRRSTSSTAGWTRPSTTARRPDETTATCA